MKAVASYGIHKYIGKKFLTIIGVVKLKKDIKRKNIRILIAEKEYTPKFIFKYMDIKKIRVLTNIYILKIPIEDLKELPINNKIEIKDITKEGRNYRSVLGYSIFSKKCKYKLSNIKVSQNKETSMYIRQDFNNKMILTVREYNKTDSFKEQLKLNFAKLISKLGDKEKVLLYEKESEKYEESASIVFEKLIEAGYKNVYFVIDKKSVYVNNIDEKYKKNIIWKYSIKHYVLFFNAKTFIGTESPSHALELRTANKNVIKRVYGNQFKYVFLQHGVMYMVSLNSKGRSFFRKGKLMPSDSKIVVSSEEEANHFIELGGYTREELYLTGLPKFDKNTINENPNKIVVMPTWRPWEYNQIRSNYSETGYYKMLEEILNAIPNKLLENLIILPHPLVKDSLINTEISKYMIEECKYDEILKQTKVLITDYSSIAYDAFYRGSNVIFWWKEKEECMENYGGHLMLNETNVFGDVCFNKDELSNVIESNYDNIQTDKFIEKYQKIVEFKDGENTNRLIECLKRDVYLKKK